MQGRWPELLPIRPSAHARDPQDADGRDRLTLGAILLRLVMRYVHPHADHMKAAMLRYDALQGPAKVEAQ